MLTFAQKPQASSKATSAQPANARRAPVKSSDAANARVTGNQAALRMQQNDRESFAPAVNMPSTAPVSGKTADGAQGEGQEWLPMAGNGTGLDHGGTLPYREATELAECVRIMGDESYCRQTVLGEAPGMAAASKPTLQKSTVSGPTPSDCGGFKWIVQWKLDQPSTQGGWVIQKVEMPDDAKDCSDKLVDRKKVGGFQPDWFPFWEAWPINKNQKVTTYAEGGDLEDDTFSEPSVGSDSKGPATLKGTPEFYEGLTLPPSFKVTNKPPTGILPTTKSAPTLTGGTGSISHSITAAWDCCSKEPAATKQTKITTV